jgi:HlyD family secretion protein
MKKRKRLIIILVVVVLLVAGIVGMRALGLRQLNSLVAGLETQTVERGALLSLIEADGVVRSEQHAVLLWETTGKVLDVDVAVGDAVFSGATLATLDQHSLPRQIILAQADLVEAQKALDDLLISKLQGAQAHKAVENAERALDDASNSGLGQAQALAAIAVAERLLENAERKLSILITPPSEMSVQQVYANILLTEEYIIDLEEQIVDLEKALKRAKNNPYESYSLYKTLLRNTEMELARQQERLLERQERYAELLAPPDSMDFMIAEAEVMAAQANLADARKHWGRIKDGPTQADFAVLEAQLADAQREWARVKDGPTQDDIAVAEARIAATQSILDSVQLTAPFDGVITLVDIQAGDLVEFGSPAFRLDDFSRLLIDLQVSEIDINKIVIDQNVVLTFDSVLAKEYQGRVVDIAPVGDVAAGVVTFSVCVELVDAGTEIRPGMTSAVQIEIGRVEDVLLIPSQAIRSLEGQRVVYLLGDSQTLEPSATNLEGRQTIPIYPVSITLGVSSSEFSEIIAGDLQAGDVVVLDPPIELINSQTGPSSP